LAAASYALHAEWYPILTSESGIDSEFEVAGTTHLAKTKADRANLNGIEQQCQDELIPYARLSHAEIRQQFPCLPSSSSEDTAAAAIHLPCDAQLRSRRLLKALEAACSRRGVRLVSNIGAAKLLLCGDRVTQVQTDAQGSISGDEFVVAAGAWSGELLSPIGFDLGFVPIRGQIAFYQLSSRPFIPCVYAGGNYLVAWRDGGLLAGSTIEDVGFDGSTTPEAIAGLSSFAASIVPELGSREPDRVWAGLRPATYDGFPFIGRLPGVDNLLVAAGHFRAGILLAPITADVITRLAKGDDPGIDLSPFRPRSRSTTSNSR
jgi:glycine oxidase